MEDCGELRVTLGISLNAPAMIASREWLDDEDELGPVILRDNVKEHAPLSARASVDHGVGIETTGEHENSAADRGCCVSTCWASWIFRVRCTAKG